MRITIQMIRTFASLTGKRSGNNGISKIPPLSLMVPRKKNLLLKIDHKQPSQLSTSGLTSKITFPFGSSSKFDNIWLRDHCPCPQCRHPITKQRMVDTFSIASNIKPRSIKVIGNEVEIVWNDTENHKSTYPVAFLQKYSYNPELAQQKSTQGQGQQYKVWGREVSRSVPSVTFSEVMKNDVGLAKWLSLIEKYGFCLVKNIPLNVKDSESLARRIAFIRETHYGGFWQFESNMKHGDTAYTNLALGAHTDTTYFTDPIGLQMLHMLENKAKGGETLLVDGFKIATILRELDPKAFQTLCRVKIPSCYVGDAGVVHMPEPHPLIKVNEVTGEIIQIRYNNNDRAPLSPAVTNVRDSEDIQEFYRALKVWNKLLTSHKNEFWFQLTAGTAVIFNNWRVLHGRSSFTGGPRRLCGCYINFDDYRSRLTTLRHLIPDKKND